jgi:hypothetical protein
MDEVVNTDTDYPKTLYREGTEFVWDGKPTVSLIVANEDEHMAADGWKTAAEYLTPIEAKAKK